jgi:transcriptional regulator with XRE-family HTH domain
MRLASIMRRWRINEEKSVRHVAAEIGIDHSTYWRFEQGKGIDAKAFVKILAWITASEPDALAAAGQECG